MADTFTVFSKMGDVLATLSEEDARELSYVLMMYGSLGVEVKTSYVVGALFAAFREDIDNSKEMRSRGSKGGRPAKKQQVEKVIEKRKPEVFEVSKPGFDKPETMVSRKSKPKPNQTKPNQTILNQTKPSQTKPSQSEGGASAPAPAHPASVEEAVAYFGANCLNGDPREFYDHFQAQGWVRSNGLPIGDWRAAARTWASKQREVDAHRRAVEEADRLRVERFKPPEARAPIESMPRTYDEIMAEEMRKVEAMNGA